jgi:superfamily II DNA or RNA helicase
MYEFLNSVELSVLTKFVRSQISPEFSRSIDSLERERVYSILFSLYGFDLLYEKRIRLNLLETLDSDKLLKISSEFGIQRYEKLFDTCLSLSAVQWRQGSEIVRTFARIFSIPSEFLPSKLRNNDLVEVVEPYIAPQDLLDYQQDISSKVVEIMKDDNKRAFIIQLPTGAGKTRTAVDALVEHYNLKDFGMTAASILWLAHTEELCEQAADTFRRVWQHKGSCDIKIVRFWGQYNPHVEDFGNSFIIGTFQKLHNFLNNDEENFNLLRERLKVVVVDEAHKALAITYKKLLKALTVDKEVYLMGLTATPGRGKDASHENQALVDMFGGVLISSDLLGVDPVKTLQERGILANIRRILAESHIKDGLSDKEVREAKIFNDLPYSVLNRLANNNERNKLITSIIENEIQKGHKCLVFACTVEHAKQLCVFVGMRGLRAAYISCDMRRGLRRRTIQEFKASKIDVIFNYGVLSTGFDAPNINTIVIARPTSSIVLYSQMIGRGLRGVNIGGTEYCNLIDIKDNFQNFGGVSEVYNYFEGFWNKKLME